jgi:predicted ATPase
LAGLNDDGVAELMAEVAGVAVSAELARKVRQRTGGNPLFVRELTRLLAARADLSAGDVALPVWLDTVRVTLEGRLAALSPSCVAVLHVAAVLGTEFRLESLRPILTDTGELPDILAEAVRGKVLAGEPGADVYRFSHDMFRETLPARSSARPRYTRDDAMTRRALPGPRWGFMISARRPAYRTPSPSTC